MLSRCAAVTASVTALMLVGAGATWAGDDGWGSVDCDQEAFAGCELAAGQAPDAATGPDHGDGPSPARPAGDGGTASGECSYVPADYEVPAGGTSSASGGTSGGWALYRCPGYSLYRGPMWLPSGASSAGTGGGGVVSPADLAVAAYRQLRLPAPEIGASPPGPQLVNLPIWLWLDPDSWAPQSATVSVPGVSVTATATPTRVVWSMGDGAEVTCRSAGTSFPAGADPAAASPDCGHTYRFSSQGRPGGSFPVTATVFWSVRWSGAGQDGRFDDLSTTSATAWQVVESQGVNTG